MATLDELRDRSALNHIREKQLRMRARAELQKLNDWMNKQAIAGKAANITPAIGQLYRSLQHYVATGTKDYITNQLLEHLEKNVGAVDFAEAYKNKPGARLIN